MLITQLETGEVDLAVGGFPALSAGVREQSLYEDGYVCIMRRGHPLLERPLTFDGFCDASHILVRARNLGHVQQEVELQLLDLLPSQNIRLVTESVVTAMMLIGSSELVLTAPSRVAALLEPRCDLATTPLPLMLPRFQVKLYWHERYDKDLGLAWLRQGAASLCCD